MVIKNKHLDLHETIAEIVAEHVAFKLKEVDDRVIEAIVRVYKLHNDGMECPCDYCLAMRMAADLAQQEASKFWDNDTIVLDLDT